MASTTISNYRLLAHLQSNGLPFTGRTQLPCVFHFTRSSQATFIRDRVTEARACFMQARELILLSDDLSYSAGRADRCETAIEKIDAKHRTSKAKGTRERRSVPSVPLGIIRGREGSGKVVDNNGLNVDNSAQKPYSSHAISQRIYHVYTFRQRAYPDAESSPNR